MYPFRKILVATDFEDSSAGALDIASGLARQYEAELVLVHAVEMFIPTYPLELMPELAEIERAAKASLDALATRMMAVWPATRSVILWGSPAEQIVRYAEEDGADLVVVGTHGRSGPSRWFLGSVAARVTKACHTPVLTVHEGDDGSRREQAAPSGGAPASHPTRP